MNRSAPVIFTVGHSTRSLDELVAILRAHGVERLVDVCTIPRSRQNPQFNRETLSKALHNRHLSSSFALSERRNFGASWKNWESWVFSRSHKTGGYRKNSNQSAKTW
jgi:hypothetical protein